MRGLTALGKTEDSYGTMRIPIILGKMPINVHRNLAREHGNSEWTITELKDTILKEIEVLESMPFPLNTTPYESHVA